MTTYNPVAAEAVEVLAREIRATRNKLTNAIVCRRDHPSYGYTKKSILETLAILEGMLFAYWIIVTGEGTGSPLLFIRNAATEVLDENIDTLRHRAEAS